MQKIINARLKLPPRDNDSEVDNDIDNDIGSLEQRIQKILGIVRDTKTKDNHMVFFVMYDIHSNKVRRLVFKYLTRKGCTPIQRSIFLAEAPTDVFQQIQSDLDEVQQEYENNDSIILPTRHIKCCQPCSVMGFGHKHTTDYLRMMKIIGQHIAVDVITHNKSTLFF